MMTQPNTHKSKSKIINNNHSILPLTNSNFHSGSEHPPKSYSTQLNEYYIYLKYQSQPSEIFSIKIISNKARKVYDIELTKEILAEIDSNVLITFQTLQTMYREFVQILCTQPNDFEISDDSNNGIIKVKVVISLKSGPKKKQLILVTQRREMTNIELIQMQRGEIETKMKQQLSLCRKENESLRKILQQMKQQFKAQITNLEKRMQKQNAAEQKIRKQLQQRVEQLEKIVTDQQLCISGQQIIIELLEEKAEKIILTANKNSKFFYQDYQVQQLEQNNKKQMRIIKKTKQRWSQLLFNEKITPKISYWNIRINKTKNKYICVGLTDSSSINQQDSKWSKKSITLFLLDKSIIYEGKQININPSQKQLQTNSQIKSNISQKKQQINIIIIVNGSNKTIEWYENYCKIGVVKYSKQFDELIEANQIRPFIIMKDNKDQLII